jgi:hypothetical protein
MDVESVENVWWYAGGISGFLSLTILTQIVGHHTPFGMTNQSDMTNQSAHCILYKMFGHTTPVSHYH